MRIHLERDFLVSIGEYLSQRPYREVAGFVGMIQQEINAQTMAAAAKANIEQSGGDTKTAD